MKTLVKVIRGSTVFFQRLIKKLAEGFRIGFHLFSANIIFKYLYYYKITNNHWLDYCQIIE